MGEASRSNPGDSYYGICFRNWEGNLVYAQTEQIGIATNIEAEARAIKITLKISLEKGWHRVVIETNLRKTMNIIYKKWRCPWELVEEIEEIDDYLQHPNRSIKHMFREGNQLADFLANRAFISEENKFFTHSKNYLQRINIFLIVTSHRCYI